MQAIRTRYHGPTNTRGARIIAKCAGGSVSVPFRYHLRIEEMHKFACDKLCEKLGWTGEMIDGDFNGDTYWVFVK